MHIVGHEELGVDRLVYALGDVVQIVEHDLYVTQVRGVRARGHVAHALGHEMQVMEHNGSRIGTQYLSTFWIV